MDRRTLLYPSNHQHIVILNKNWVWPVTPENWPKVKNENVWAVGGNPDKGRQVTQGDRIIFYVKSSGCFQGIFEVVSDWHDPTGKWADPEHSTTTAEIDLKPIQLGYAEIEKLLDRLEFIRRKKHWGMYLMGNPKGPANFAKPISEDDYHLVFAELKRVHEKPYEEKPFENKLENSENTEFVSIKSWNFIEERIHKLSSPNLKDINSIISDIKDGRYAVPIFQREFTWNRRQVEELWESIFQGFFIGSILTWAFADQIETIPVFGATKSKEDDIRDILLDGQQRVTSLFYAVTAPDVALTNTRPMLFFVNLKALLDPDTDTADIVFSITTDKAKKSGYLDKEVQFTKKIFPLTLFDNRDYTLWLGEFKTYMMEEGLENADDYYKQILSIMDHVWFQYQIPVVQLPKSLVLDSVAEIFEKINSRGTKLGVFDLLNARFTKYDVNLRNLWDEAKSDFPNIQDMEENFGDASKSTLQGLCLFKTGYTRRKGLLTMDDSYKTSNTFQKVDFLNDWSSMCQHTSAAIDLLKSHRDEGFGSVLLSMTPYTVVVPILASLLYKIENRSDRPKCMSKIQNWYWSAVTSDSYSGSTDTKVEKDYREILRWFDDDDHIPEIVREQRDVVNNMDLDTANKNDSLYRAIICLIAKSGANDFATNAPLECNTLDIHHIFPKSKKDAYPNQVSINSILNMTVLDRDTNRTLLSDKIPSEYIPSIMKEQQINESDIRRRLKTHLISDEAFDCLLKNDFDGFVRARKLTIRNTLRKLIMPATNSGHSINTKQDIGDLLHNKESQTLEYKSSMRWDIRLNHVNHALEETLIKEFCAFMNTNGGNLLIGVDDDGNPIGLEKDYSTFKTPGYDSFAQHITNLINNYLGKEKNQYVELEPILAEDHEICWCRISHSSESVFLNKDNDKKFFIRANNTCQPLDAEATHKYINQHWKK